MSVGLATSGNAAVGTLGSHGYVEEGVEAAPNPPIAPDNLFFQADLFVNKIRNEVALIPITYIRNGVSINIFATPAMTVFRYLDRHMISQRKESRDYIINVIDIVFGEVQTDPKDDDLIIEDTQFERFTYEVSAFNGEPSWKHSGAYRQAFRIHTKLINKEDI